MSCNLYVVIELNDGKKETFSIPIKTDSAIYERNRLRELFKSNYVIFSTEDDILAYPSTSIRSIRMSKIFRSVESKEIDSFLPLSSFKNVHRH